MDWLNYHHLMYFWVVAREGTIAAACEELMLSQPTISAQIKTLEQSLGTKLFRRSGRYLVLTEAGELAYRFADEIFSLGHEMVETLKGRVTGSPVRFNVGLADVLPKLIAFRLLEPALQLPEPIRLICHESTQKDLLAKLAVCELDLVLSDSPVSPSVKVRAYNHLLGECGVCIFGTAALVESHRRRFPASLDDAPLLMPTETTALRRNLDRWFDAEGVRPQIVGEFDDSALLKVFAQSGAGMFAAPDVMEKEIRKQYDMRVVGRIESVREQYYAISVERQIKHPAVVAITDSAREKIFA